MDLIRKHEGFSDEVYLDTVGVPTGGYGHAFHVGSHIPVYVAEAMLWMDVKAALDDYSKLTHRFKWDLSETRKSVIVNMLFNLGRSRFLGFKNMIRAVIAEDWDTAADEMLSSKWAGQVKGRAIELSNMMRSG